MSCAWSLPEWMTSSQADRRESRVTVGSASTDLEQGLGEHERSAQLVGGVDDEPSLGVERRFEAGQ